MKNLYYVVSFWDTTAGSRMYEGYSLDKQIAELYLDQAGEVFDDGSRRVMIKLPERVFNQLVEEHGRIEEFYMAQGAVLTPDLEQELMEWADGEMEHILENIYELGNILKAFKGSEVTIFRKALKRFKRYAESSDLYNDMKPTRLLKLTNNMHNE